MLSENNNEFSCLKTTTCVAQVWITENIFKEKASKYGLRFCMKFFKPSCCTETPAVQFHGETTLYHFTHCHRGWIRLLKTRFLILRLPRCIMCGWCVSQNYGITGRVRMRYLTLSLVLLFIFSQFGDDSIRCFYNPRTKHSDANRFVVNGGLAL